ncbi:MAG: efflux RND transporter periplasmic adaptor subunit [Vicinamibacterales bacterium]
MGADEDASPTAGESTAVSVFGRRPGLWIAVAVLLAAALLGVFQARGPLVQVAVVTRSDIQQHLIASGRVRVVTRVQLTAQVAGRVTQVAVREGHRVRPGELLAQIDDQEARSAVAEARAAAAQARSRVEQLREVSAVVAGERLREAEANYSRAESELARSEALAKAGVVAARDLEDARQTVAVAAAARSAARAQQQGAAAQGADTRVAESALRESEARLAAAQVRLAQTRVVAAQAGVVLGRLVERGDIVRVGDTLFDLAGEGETEIVIEPDERNLAWLRVGQTGKASADAYPDQVFDAEITYIAPAVDRQRGSIEVRLRVPDPPATLRPDMTVSVDLTVASRRNALTVPTDAIRDAATAAPWVFLVDTGRVVRRDVTLGIAGEGQSEIASGVSAGDVVALSAARGLEPGQRVRVQEAR